MKRFQNMREVYLCNDVIGKIFENLQWNDEINVSHIIDKKPSQFRIAYKKLADKNFDPHKQQKSLFIRALQTGNIDICTDAMIQIYLETLDCRNMDYSEIRQQIYNDLKNHDKESRIDRVWMLKKVWNESLSEI